MRNANHRWDDWIEEGFKLVRKHEDALDMEQKDALHRLSIRMNKVAYEALIPRF